MNNDGTENTFTDAMRIMFKAGIDFGINMSFDILLKSIKEASKDGLFLKLSSSDALEVLVASLSEVKNVAINAANEGDALTKAWEQMPKTAH